MLFGPKRNSLQIGLETEERPLALQQQEEGERLLRRRHQVQAEVQSRIRSLDGNEKDLHAKRSVGRTRVRVSTSVLPKHFSGSE